jgi:hypothetical protein
MNNLGYFGNESTTMKINLAWFKIIIPDAEQTKITGNADAKNATDHGS